MSKPDKVCPTRINDNHKWPLWYADYLHEKFTDWLNVRFTKSELVYLLVKADKELRASASQQAWPEYYARLFNEYAERQWRLTSPPDPLSTRGEGE